MATLKISHALVKANPGILKKIQDYFDTMYIFDEQDEYTIYQVEMADKIGNIQIVVHFEATDSGVVVSGFSPA